jgi:hypothetical protein
LKSYTRERQREREDRGKRARSDRRREREVEGRKASKMKREERKGGEVRRESTFTVMVEESCWFGSISA